MFDLITSLLLILLLHIHSSSGIPDFNDERIANGTATTIEEYPFIVSIQWMTYHICGGVIVKPEYILTSAKCIGTFKEAELKVLAGTTQRNNYDPFISQQRDIKSIKHHEKLDTKTWAYDIAIIELSEPLIEDARVKPIGFYEGEDPIDVWTDMTMIGWGVLVEGASFNPIDLHKTPMRSYSTSNCKVEYERFNRSIDPNTMFCGLAFDVLVNGYLNGGPCDGDWGGPIITTVTDEDVEPKLVGLASWGFGCNLNFATVFTNLQGVRRFIIDNAHVWEDILSKLEVNGKDSLLT